MWRHLISLLFLAVRVSTQFSINATTTQYRFTTEQSPTPYTMSTRFPPGESSSLGDSFEAEVKKHWGENPNFKYKDEDGAPIGPFAVLA